MNCLRFFRLQPKRFVPVFLFFYALICSAFGQYGVNLLTNPGAEDFQLAVPGHASNPNYIADFPGWTRQGNVYRNSYADYPVMPGPANGGLSYFMGGNQATTSLQQVVSVAFAANEIDQGNVVYNASGWFGGWENHEDFAQLRLFFLTASNAIIGQSVFGKVTVQDRNTAPETSMLFRQQSGTLPLGTRSVRARLEMNRLLGTANNGCADNLLFEILTVLPPTVTLTGKVTLEGYVGDPTRITVTVETRAPGSSSALQTFMTSLNANSEYTLVDIPRGQYDIAFHADRWLRKIARNVPATNAVNKLDISLPNGDAQVDNRVDDLDLFALTQDFLSAPGSASGNTNTDLNGDGKVDDFDLFLLTSNFLTSGD